MNALKSKRNLEWTLAKIESIRAKAVESRSGSSASSSEECLSSLHQLPAWADVSRGAPNPALRGSLFSIRRPERIRQRVDNMRIATLGPFEILYSGELLDQGDLDVWLAVLHLVRGSSLGSACKVRIVDLLRASGKSDSTNNRQLLDTRLKRMMARVTVKNDNLEYNGTLIQQTARLVSTGEYMIKLDPNLHRLFGAGQWTGLDWKIRRLLCKKPMAQWLHGFYSTHAAPFPMYVASLRTLCGSQDSALSSFRRELHKNLQYVQAAARESGQVFDFEIRNDKVFVTRTPSRSQARHLNDKLGRKLLRQI